MVQEKGDHYGERTDNTNTGERTGETRDKDMGQAGKPERKEQKHADTSTIIEKCKQIRFSRNRAKIDTQH